MAEWQHGLFGCFDNIGVCIITYFVPCYTFGKNAEGVGDSCCMCGILYFVPIANIIALLQVREKVRTKFGISGGLCGDLLAICCCHLCALVQESQQLCQSPPQTVTIARQ